MNLSQVIFTSTAVSVLVLVASLGIFSYAAANGAATSLIHGNFKRMHSMDSRDSKMQHIKSYCEESGNINFHHAVKFIEDRFNFTDSQKLHWNSVIEALNSEETTVQIICDKILTKENHETTPARMELMETVVITGLEAMQRLRPVITDFYVSLDEKQKQTFDNLLSHKNQRHPDHI